MMPKAILSPQAEEDLSDIGAYTEKQWGKRQRKKYIAQLINKIKKLAKNPTNYIPMKGQIGSLLATNNLAILLEIVIILVPVYFGYALITHIGGNSLRAGIFIGTPTVVISIMLIHFSLWLRGDNWSEFGLNMPNSWLRTGLWSLGVIVTVSLSVVVVQNIATQVFETKPLDTSRFEALRGNLPLLITAVLSIWISAAFGEEILVRGFLLNRFAEMLGESRLSWLFAVILSSVVFGLGHFFQGMTGVIVTSGVGIVYAIMYLLTGKNLWVTILAHGILDTIGFVSIYAAQQKS